MRRFLLATCLWLAPAGTALAAPPTVGAHHGNFSHSGGTTLTVNITASAGDVIYLCGGFESTSGTPAARTVTITDAASLTWVSRVSLTNTPLAGTSNGIGFRTACWYAVTPGALSSSLVTLTTNAAYDDASGAYVIATGVSATIVDPNTNAHQSSVYADATTATAASFNITTTLANDVIIAVTAGADGSTCGQNFQLGGTDFTSLTDGGRELSQNSAGTRVSCLELGWAPVSVTKSAVSVVTTSTGASTKAWSAAIDALTADSVVTTTHVRFAPSFP